MSKTLALVLLAAAAFTPSVEARWALVTGGEVRQVWETKPSFHPDVTKDIALVDASVEPGWRKVGGAFLPPKTPVEKAQEAFDAKRSVLVSATSREAHKQMSAEWKYKLTGSLATGYPDTTQPLCQTSGGEVLTLDEFMVYIQEREDDGASNAELNNLKAIAKDVRKYFRTLKP